MHSRVRIQQKGKMYSSSGGSRGGVWGAQPPLIFSPNWGPKGLKKILETSPPPPLSKSLDDHPSPPISRSESGTEQGSQKCQTWRILHQKFWDDSSEVREGVTLIETAYIEELLACVQVEAKLQ